MIFYHASHNMLRSTKNRYKKHLAPNIIGHNKKPSQKRLEPKGYATHLPAHICSNTLKTKTKPGCAAYPPAGRTTTPATHFLFNFYTLYIRDVCNTVLLQPLRLKLIKKKNKCRGRHAGLPHKQNIITLQLGEQMYSSIPWSE